MTTGAYKKANVYNIYDMAGNLSEWTMEGYGYSEWDTRVVRGGNYDEGGSVASRNHGYNPNYWHYLCGFRPSLYIK